MLHQSVRRRKNPKTHVKRSVLLLLLGLLDTGGLYPTDSYGYRTCLHIQNSSHLLREFRVAKTSWLFLTLRERGVTLEAFATMLWLFFWILACKCTCRLCVCACDVYYVCVFHVCLLFFILFLLSRLYIVSASCPKDPKLVPRKKDSKEAKEESREPKQKPQNVSVGHGPQPGWRESTLW